MLVTRATAVLSQTRKGTSRIPRGGDQNTPPPLPWDSHLTSDRLARLGTFCPQLSLRAHLHLQKGNAGSTCVRGL